MKRVYNISARNNGVFKLTYEVSEDEVDVYREALRNNVSEEFEVKDPDAKGTWTVAEVKTDKDGGYKVVIFVVTSKADTAKMGEHMFLYGLGLSLFEEGKNE